MSESIVIIPTYNEKENIEKMVHAIFSLAYPFHIVIIEDNSPDGTAGIIRALQQQYADRLYMIERKGKLGLGTAYIAGFKWALSQNYTYIFEMDADFSHNPDDIPVLLEAAQDADLVLGSRYLNGISIVNWPLSRLMLSKSAAKYVQVVTGMPFTDPTGGFKCFRREVLEAGTEGHRRPSGVDEGHARRRIEDLPDVAGRHGVRFDDGEGALDGHGDLPVQTTSLPCDRKPNKQ